MEYSAQCSNVLSWVQRNDTTKWLLHTWFYKSVAMWLNVGKHGMFRTRVLNTEGRMSHCVIYRCHTGCDTYVTPGNVTLWHKSAGLAELRRKCVRNRWQKKGALALARMPHLQLIFSFQQICWRGCWRGCSRGCWRGCWRYGDEDGDDGITTMRPWIHPPFPALIVAPPKACSSSPTPPCRKSLMIMIRMNIRIMMLVMMRLFTCWWCQSNASQIPRGHAV